MFWDILWGWFIWWEELRSIPVYKTIRPIQSMPSQINDMKHMNQSVDPEIKSSLFSYIFNRVNISSITNFLPLNHKVPHVGVVYQIKVIVSNSIFVIKKNLPFKLTFYDLQSLTFLYFLDQNKYIFGNQFWATFVWFSKSNHIIIMMTLNNSQFSIQILFKYVQISIPISNIDPVNFVKVCTTVYDAHINFN